MIEQETKDLIDKLLLEKLPLAGIARVTGVSERWLQTDNALDIETKEIVGVYIGERSRKGAQELWQSLPALYRQCAVCYTDFWIADRGDFSSI